MLEFGESMDTGAPMDTAESKVITNIVLWAHHNFNMLKNTSFLILSFQIEQ